MTSVKEYVSMLTCTNLETLQKIEQYEREKRFNEHLDDQVAPYIPVTQDYEYITRSPLKKIRNAFYKIFVVRPFMNEANKTLRTVVRGKENLVGLDRAIVCYNHVNKLDNTAIKKALGHRKIYFTTAEFNNLQGFLGEMMRIGGILPMSSNISAMKNFDSAITELLNKKSFITFSPECSEWWGYEKPRPQLRGAYHYAVKNHVPVLPIFITFEDTKQSKTDPTAIKTHVVNILPPIYPNLEAPARQEEQRLMDLCENAFIDKYEATYNKKYQL